MNAKGAVSGNCGKTGEDPGSKPADMESEVRDGGCRTVKVWLGVNCSSQGQCH